MAKPPKLTMLIRRYPDPEMLPDVWIKQTFGTYTNGPLHGQMPHKEAIRLAEQLGLEVEYDDTSYPAKKKLFK